MPAEEEKKEEATSTTPEEKPQQEEETQEKEETTEEKRERGKTLLVEGKRHFLASSYAEACKCLADSCELHASVFGDFDEKCGDPYFYYGKSLLELARMEPGVFTNALNGVSGEEGDSSAEEEEMEVGEEGEPKEEDPKKDTQDKDDEQFGDPEKLTEEEREELHDMVEDALEENAEALAKGKIPEQEDPKEGEETKEAESTTPDEETGEKTEEEPVLDKTQDPEKDEDADKPQAEGGEGSGEVEESKEGDGEDVEKAEETGEVSNLQLAWEMLDMARIIFEKLDLKEKMAECYSALGDVAIEDERYDKALEDLTTCLNIQKALYPPTDRTIAETYFQLGRAQNLSSKFSEAATSFGAALGVIQGRKGVVETELGKAEDEESKAKLQKELDDLTALIPDIQNKVSDAEGSQKSADEREKEMEEGGEAPKATTEIGFGAAEDDGAGDKETKNIGHLVRKPLKRKPEEEGDEAKRAKTEENGVESEAGVDAPMTNGISNGHAPEVEG